MNKEDRLPGWLYTRDMTAKLICYFRTENWLIFVQKRMESTQAAHMPLLRSLPVVTVQDRNEI